MTENPFFYPSIVLDDQDPLMLGRVRARVLTDNYNDIISSITNPIWNEAKDKWTARDPFVFLPLLPYFIYQVPKVNELIYAFYYNKEYKFQNQFYIQATYSSPTLSPFEYYVGAQKNTGVGIQYKNPLPLKNQDGTYASKENVGVFPEPGDNALLGRGSSDIIVKENDVIIRAGKTIGPILPNEIPAANNTRAFLQISKFQNIKVLDDIKSFIEEQEKVVLVKYLVEWVITNPENTQNSFTGTIYLYKLRPDIKTNSKELKVDSDIENFKSLILSQEFNALTIQETITFINDFIIKCNKEESINGRKIFNESPFPFFYRPNNSTYSKILSNPTTTLSQVAISNLNTIYNGIKLNNSTKVKGYGLVYAKDKIGYPYDVKTTTQPIFKYNNTPVTFAAMGADKMALLSHQSSIPGKSKINFDGTLYGISNDAYTDEILPNTSSMVRGEELLELLNLIVRFLITHTHAFPGLPPVPVTQDGTNTTTILSEMQNAVNKILNQNIRLN
jgi:hypothetical protein